jgi:hypothetical protein
LPKSSISINNTYKIGKYDEPGVYNVESTLKDNTGKIVSFKTANFNVKVVNVTENLLTEYTQKKSSFNLFSIKTTITTKNEGNVASPSFYVTESVPSIVKFLFDPNIEPSKVTKAEGGRTVYGWLILSLEPGKQATITYNYNIWIIWLSILIIGGLIYVIIRFMYKPSILKTYKHQGKISKEKEVLISLDVRNRTRHEIKDVEVRDIVPSIVKVVERFDTIVPRIKTTEVGTELRWKLDSLKPKEERVLTYRVKPLLEMSGTLNLPKAHVKYFDRKKIKRIIASKAILIQG